MLKAKTLIKDSGQEFSPDKHEVKLIFMGKIMGEDQALGNYVKKSEPVLVFKRDKFTNN